MAVCLIVFPVLIAIILVFAFVVPLLERPAMLAEDMELHITVGKRGSVELSWDAGKYTSGYRLELFNAEEEGGTPLFERFCRSARCTLRAADLPKADFVRVRITARDLLYFTDQNDGKEEASASWACSLSAPEIRDAQNAVNTDEQRIELSWMGWEKDTYTLWMVDADGDRKFVQEFAPSGMTDGPAGEWKRFEENINYGPRGRMRLPADDGEYVLEMEVTREQPFVTFQGETAQLMSITRGDLMSKEIVLTYDRLEHNRYRLYWNDTGSFSYRVEMRAPDAEDYEKITTVNSGGDLVCETEHLQAGREYAFRVVPLSEEEAFDPFAGGASASDDGGITVMTDPDALYASIWPMRALDIYADTDRAETVGTAAPDRSLCVLEEDTENALFRVRTDEAEGYIDSNYCMINLPDYVGDLCQYDIPNSYAAIYRVNGYYIPNVTGVVTPGYEHILLDDDTFVVPLLYPVAQKLVIAARATLTDGYRIEINDSFRPHCATRSIYDETNKVLYWRLPDITCQTVSLEKYRLNNGVIEIPISAKPPGVVEQTLSEQVTDDAAEGAAELGEDAGMQRVDAEAQVAATENIRYTYYWEMTNGTYRLGSFLAAVASRHNIGVAMDMTLVNVSDGRKIDTQTEMHNLSWYSAMSRNNENADRLKGYLTDAGFGTISSEWWHFQDNDLTAQLNPPIVENGVSIEGWKRDDYGWRYRDDKGNYLTDEAREIDGWRYSFDEKGYTDR